MRSKPKGGFTLSQSYFDFETNSEKLRFGMEENKLFIEIDEVKTFITDANGNIIADLSTDVITAVSGIITTLNTITGNITTINATTGNIDSVIATSVASDSIDVDVLDTLTLVAPADTPVNAVASAGKITSSGALVPASHATSEIESSGTAVPGVYAESTVTASTIVDGDTSTINSTVYRFKTTPSQAFDVNLGADDAAALDNLKLAINANGIGDGTDYYTGTTVHPTVIATINEDTTQKVVARIIGTASNAEATTSTGGTLTWADTTLGGGAGTSVAGVAITNATITIGATVYTAVTSLAETHGLTAIPYQVYWVTSEAIFLDNLKAAINATGTPGTEASTGTDVHPDVIATTNTDTVQTIVARVPGTTANSIATTETIANYAWADTTLGGGTGNSNPGVTDAAATVTIESQVYMFVVELSEASGADAIVNQVLYGGSEAIALDNLKLAINNGLTEGTEYSTGTVENVNVVAGTNTSTTQIVTAKISGIIGDEIAITTTCANTAWDDTTLGTEVAGVDGTVGVLNQIAIDSSYFYFCLAVNTITDNNWRRISLGTAY